MKIKNATFSSLLAMTAAVVCANVAMPKELSTPSISSAESTEGESEESNRTKARIRVIKSYTRNPWGIVEGKEKERVIKNIRANIVRVEKLQPNWDSKPMKQKLDDIEAGISANPCACFACVALLLKRSVRLRSSPDLNSEYSKVQV